MGIAGDNERGGSKGSWRCTWTVSRTYTIICVQVLLIPSFVFSIFLFEKACPKATSLLVLCSFAACKIASFFLFHLLSDWNKFWRPSMHVFANIIPIQLDEPVLNGTQNQIYLHMRELRATATPITHIYGNRFIYDTQMSSYIFHTSNTYCLLYIILQRHIYQIHTNGSQ